MRRKEEELRQMAAELKPAKVAAFNAQKEAEKIRQNAEMQARNAAREVEQLRLQIQLVNSEELRQVLASKGTGQGGNPPFFRPPIFPANGAPSFGPIQFQN